MARRQGQIIPRGDHRWLVRVFLGARPGDPPAQVPKPHHLRLLSCGTALPERRSLAECDQGRELAGEDLTLNQYLDRWLELAARPKLRTKSFC